MCHLSKNLFNVGLYTMRQYFFTEGKYLSYESNYHLCKENENYQLLATDCGQQTLKYVDRCFKAFFKLLSMRKEGVYQEKINLPRYLPKDGYFPLIIPIINADANGSLNIGFKSKHEGFSRVSRVCLTQPVRVNVLRESKTIAQVIQH